MFAKETYISRRKSLAASMASAGESGILLFLGNEDTGMNYMDNTYEFRQDSTFLYYFGLDYAGFSAIIDLDNGMDTVFADDITVEDIVWVGVQPSLAEKCSMAGITSIQPKNALPDALKKALASGRKIHFLPPYRAEHILKLRDWAEYPVAQPSIPFIRAVVNMRNYKTEEEIAQIEEAVDITAEMHLSMMRNVRPGMKESDIAAEVTRIALALGSGLSFPVIATRNGQTLHNHYHGNTLKEGDLFLLDAGAENHMHYGGDLSSTVPVSGKFTERQKMIYDMALDAHMAAVHALRPGVAFKDVHIKAATVISERLKSIGLMKGDPAEAAVSGAYAMFFPCGLGHMMGLDIHDMENLGEVWVGYDGVPKSTMFGFKSLRLARKLEPGFVLTIEPGIYFIPELIDQWKSQKKFEEFLNYSEIEKFKDFGGLRNEEDYLITEDGYRRLGKYVPMTTDEVEAMR